MTRVPDRLAAIIWAQKGTSEHPEELTDRCCLSALAGLSKYLPFFGAVGIIAIAPDMSTFNLIRVRLGNT